MGTTAVRCGSQAANGTLVWQWREWDCVPWSYASATKTSPLLSRASQQQTEKRAINIPEWCSHGA